MSWLDAMAVGAPSSGGQSVGQAVGKITIDTTSLAQSRAIVVREAKLMGDALRSGVGGGAQQAAREANASLGSVTDTLGDLKKAGDAALLGLTTSGILASNRIKQMTMLFRTLAGSQEKANAQMDSLRELADKTNQPFLTLLESANGLMPALRNTNADLNKTVTLAQRLAVLDPAQGTQGAAFAIREFLNEEYISLSRRFEMSRSRLQAIVKQAAGDQGMMINLLSDYVDELGLTEDAMYSMNASGVNAFSVLRSEITETLATGFEPTANAVNTIAAGLADMLRAARQLDPELLKVASTLAGIYALTRAGSIAQSLPMIGDALSKNAAFAGASAGAAKVGVYGMAAYGGAQLGALAVRGMGQAGIGGEATEQYKDASNADVLKGAWTTVKQGMVIVADLLVKFAASLKESGMRWGNAWDVLMARINLGTGHIRDGLADLVKAVAEAAASLLDTIAEFMNKIDQVDLGHGIKFDTGLGGQADEVRGWAEELRALDDGIRTSDASMQRWRATIEAGVGITEDQRKEMDEFNQSGRDLVLGLGETLGVIEETTPKVGLLTRVIQTLGNAADVAKEAHKARDIVINDDVLAAFADFKEKQADLVRDTNEAILDEERSYAEQRAQTVEDYNRQRARMAEDEAVQDRRRQAEQASREADVQTRAAAHETELRTKLHEDLAEIDAQHNEQIAALEKNGREESEKAAEDHFKRLEAIETNKRRALLQAARKLDAIGVWEALQAAEDQRETEEDAYKDAEEERKDALAKERQDYLAAYTQQRQDRIAEYQKQLTESRTNAALQLQEMQAQFAREQQLRAEDRALQLARMNEDHQRSLAQMQAQHQQRLAQIAADANSEAVELEQAFIKTFNDLQTAAGAHQSVMLGIQQGGQTALENELRAWWARQRDMVAVSRTASGIASGVQGFVGSAASTIAGLAGKMVPDATGEGYYTYNAGGGMTWTRNATRYATGGDVRRTGIYGLERDERVLTSQTSRALRQMLGNNFSEPSLVNAASGGGRAGNSINVNGPWNITASDAREAAQQAFDMVFEAVNRARRSATA